MAGDVRGRLRLLLAVNAAVALSSRQGGHGAPAGAPGLAVPLARNDVLGLLQRSHVVVRPWQPADARAPVPKWRLSLRGGGRRCVATIEACAAAARAQSARVASQRCARGTAL